jgi:RimJ/RimL family protein N-acetyltransferase
MLNQETFFRVGSWLCMTPVRASGLSIEEADSVTPGAGNPVGVISVCRSKSGLKVEVAELTETRFEALVRMYDLFEPKRAAQGLPPVGVDRIVSWLRHLQQNGYNLLALYEGKVIGHAMLCPDGVQRAEFAIFLDQHFRNQGIGTALTFATLRYARDKGLRRLWLSVEVINSSAIRVYKKAGFRLSAMFGPEQEMGLDL